MRNPEKVRAHKRMDGRKHAAKRSATRRLKTYGLSQIEYQTMLLAQGGVCLICRGTNKKLSLGVDHNHITGAVRGLLCNKCNTAIGLLNDDPMLILAAAAYVSQPTLRIAEAS